MDFRIKIPLRTIVWMMLIAPFIRASGLQSILPGSENVYDAWAILSILIALAIYVKQFRWNKTGTFKFDLPVLLMALYCFLIMLPTVLYHENYKEHLRFSVSCIGLVLSCAILSRRAKLLFDSMTADITILLVINAISMVLYPNGMYLSRGTSGSSTNWIMGYDNHWFVFYYAAFYLAIINFVYFDRKVMSIFLIVLLHITTIYTMSGVLVFGLLLFDVILFFRLYKMKWFTIKNALIISLATSIVFIFFSQLPIVQTFVVNVYGRTASFAGRLNIWSRSLELIRSHLIFGNGRRTSDQNRIFYNMLAAVNAHNHWLEVLVEGGIATFSVFIGMIITIIKPKSAALQSDETSFYSYTVIPLFVMFMAMSMDSMQETRGVMLFWILAVAYYSKKIEQSLMTVQTKRNIRKRGKLF